jgi:hypothetical protein
MALLRRTSSTPGCCSPSSRPPALLALALAQLLVLAPRAVDAFGFNSVVALVVADGNSTFPGAVREQRSAAQPQQRRS